MKFTVTPAGVTLDPHQNLGTHIGVKATDHFTITITDTTTGELPRSGGWGFSPYLAFGVLLITGGIVMRVVHGHRQHKPGTAYPSPTGEHHS